MKIIEALKKIKDLQKKAEDLTDKIGNHSAYSSIESPVYEDQKAQIKDWLQAHHDIMAEILGLRIAIQKTNLAIKVTIEIDGRNVTKTIAEWIHRRRGLALLEKGAWQSLTDRNIKEGVVRGPSDDPVHIKLIRCYEPEERDRMVSLYDGEPSLIDAKLEIVNAVTDLLE